MKLNLLTDDQARERYPDDAAYWDEYASEPGESKRDHGAGELTQAVMIRLAELAGVVPEQGEVYLSRDWEGCLFAEVIGGPFDVLCLTDSGRIGEGGVNMPRYFDTVAAMLAHRLDRFVQ